MEMAFVKKNEELIAKNVKSVAVRKRKKKTAEHLTLPSHLSFSQLKAFGTCPLQYKYAHILRIPMRGRAVFSFGKTIHNTLYHFVKLAAKGNNINQKNLFSDSKAKQKKEALSLPDLIELYKKNWIDDWYESKDQKEEYSKLGKKILKDFYNKFIQERPRILKINGDLALETSFRLKVANNTLFGVIDRIDQTKDGIELIDYKTGKYREKLSPDNKKQLLIYQIAAEEALGFKPTKLSYYYLEEGKKVSFLGSEQEKEKEKQNIVASAEKIRNSEFRATPGWICKFCDFNSICDYAQNGTG